MSKLLSLSPGIHHDIPAEQYHADPAASSHRMMDMRQSPLHCWSKMCEPAPASDAMRFGTAFHAAILEPDVFASTYVCGRDCEALTGKGDVCGCQAKMRSLGGFYCGKHNKGRVADAVEILSVNDASAISAMRANIHQHTGARGMLEAKIDTELTLVWVDQKTKGRCKARVDALSLATCIDIKTTDDASVGGFQKSLLNFSYYRQAAWYLDGLAACGISCDSFTIIAVEKAAPFGVSVFNVADQALELGRAENAIALAEFAACQKAGVWPGYSTKLQELDLPAWAYRKSEFFDRE